MSVAEQAHARTGEPGPVGAQLARARIAHGLSIDDLYQRTNVRPPVISALERDEIGPSGGVVYARGHLRTLGQALGLDVTPLLAAFDASHPADAPPVVIPDSSDTLVTPEVSADAPRRTRSRPRWTLLMAAVLVIVIVIALLQLVLPGSGGSGHHSAAVIRPPAHAKTAAPKPAPHPPSLVFPVPAQGVTLRIVLSSKPSWLAIRDERGVELVQRVVQPSDQAFDLHANVELNATFGDAGVVAASCNGHPLGPIGAPGQVVTLILMRGSPQCPAS